MAGKRYVSQMAALRVPLQKAYREPTNSGLKLIRPRVVAKFTKAAGIRPEEEKQALELMNIRGIVLDEAEMPVHPRYRLSVWDSGLAQAEHGWSDEERERFEGLLESAEGFGSLFVRVERQPVPAPWPNYDRTGKDGKLSVAETIGKRVRELGIDPADALAYEEENKNRPDVVAIFRDMIAGREPIESEQEIEVPA